MKNLSIGQLASRAQVKVDTVRYYERRGLIPEPPRLESGYRQYPQEAIARIQFIKRAKGLGFSLREISDLFALRRDPHTTCNDIRKRAETKIKDVQAKIIDLQRIETALARLVASCTGYGPTSDCPILEALDEEE